MADSKSTAASNASNVLPLDGEIDLHVSPRVALALGQMVKKKPAKLVIDLTRVSYIDSSGLAVLIDAMQGVEEYGGIFAIAGIDRKSVV